MRRDAPPAGATLRPTVRVNGRRVRYEWGTWAAPLALVPGFALAALLGVPSPLEPITEIFARFTPIGIATALLTTLGAFARLAALFGAVSLTMPIGGVLGLVTPSQDVIADTPARHVPAWTQRAAARWCATAALALLAALPLALAAAYPAEALSALLVGACFTPIAWSLRHVDVLLGALKPLRTPLVAAVAGTSRREFLVGALANGGRAALLLSLSAYDRWAGAVADLTGHSDVLLRLFPFAAPAPRVAGFPVAGEEPEVTPVAQFYQLSKNNVDPLIAPADWSLRIDGAVRRPLTLSYADLLALPRIDQYVTLRCVSNPLGGHLMSTAYWSGVSLAALLERAGMQADAVAIAMRALDAYQELAPLDIARDPTTLLAYGMNGQTLERRHGGPVRTLLPGYFGFKNIKWVRQITVLTRVESDYWSTTGWTAAQVHTLARIDVWRQQSDSLLVAGVAFAGPRSIAAVQVRVDEGPWQSAQVHLPALSLMTWVQWRILVPLAHGEHRLTARAIDGAGQPQDSRAAPIYPDGARGLHSVQVVLP